MKQKAYKSWRWASKAAGKLKYHTAYPKDADGFYRVRPMTQQEKERAIRGEEMHQIMLRVYAGPIREMLNRLDVSRLFRKSR